MATASFSRTVPPPGGADTCGFKPFPVTSLSSPADGALPLRCSDPLMTCSTSGSYKGCLSTIPTTCYETSTLARSCEPDELCCGTGFDTACWTWFSMEDTRTFTLFTCSTVSGVGILMPDSTIATPSPGTDPSSPTDLPGTNMDAAATAASNGTNSTATGASAAAETNPTATGPTSRTPEGGVGVSIGVIVGTTIGALALVGMILGIALFIWIRSRKEKKKKRDAAKPEPISPVTGPDGIIMGPFCSGGRESAPPSYDGRPSEGAGEAKSPSPRSPPTKSPPPRSPPTKSLPPRSPPPKNPPPQSPPTKNPPPKSPPTKNPPPRSPPTKNPPPRSPPTKSPPPKNPPPRSPPTKNPPPRSPPPRRPDRSPERKINVTEGGWL
ncbi:uncharacterized protein LY79DRAFT_336721 [Colletotrichum navitas]|uniref:Uncharacterized protein n=1 Tax=Colletotrichum navitas TaxID=681940 RepID=A0AAD8PSA4_9PEZI|nr:uncharacterized protein LY79DRAFT_336721 [Colletotrichum navitas]KAK1579701.1 hypothetical protein LY79DRAFT_336721 [Colletotrichum navitas]